MVWPGRRMSSSSAGKWPTIPIILPPAHQANRTYLQHTAAAHRVGLTNTAAPIVGLGFVDDTLYGFTFGPAVGEPNKVLKISRGTGKAKVVTSQDPSLDHLRGDSRATGALTPVRFALFDGTIDNPIEDAS